MTRLVVVPVDEPRTSRRTFSSSAGHENIQVAVRGCGTLTAIAAPLVQPVGS